MIKYWVFLLAVVSVYGRVTIKDEDISNVIEEGNKIVKIQIVTDNILTNEENTIADTKNTCLNVLDVDNTINTNNQPCEQDNKVDNGTALILTPYIKEDRIQEARNASKVDPKQFLGFESYSGFLTVNETYNSNIFFWYFPAVKPTNDTPCLIWLQGGPGASSLVGLFDEIGPFRVQIDGSLIQNPYTWLQNHSLVFIDNPVGAGYSFTDHKDGYVKDMDTYGKHLYEATKQLVQIFPELRVAPLYVAGESYAGKYVPALGMEIHRHKNTPFGDINLKGFIIGNAFVHPSMLADIVRPFYHFGLLEKEQIDAVKPLLDKFQSDIANNRSVSAKYDFNHIIVAFLTLSNQRHAYNFLREDMGVGKFTRFLSRAEIKRALHVGDINFSVVNVTVNMEMAPDFLSSSKGMFEELLEHYRVLAYCGQLDQMIPCVSSSENYRTWQWSRSSDFIEAPRLPFKLNATTVGYHKSGGGFTSAMIRGAGHMVPTDAPAPVQKLVTLWTHSEPLPTITNKILLYTVFTRNFTLNATFVYL